MVRFERKAGAPIEHGGCTLVPVAEAWCILLPGRIGGLLWNRPAAIEVGPPGRREAIRVADRTRQIQWLIWATGLAVGLLLRRRRRRIAGR